MKIMKTIKINEHISVGLKAPFTLIAGPCVIESKELVLETGEKIKAITRTSRNELYIKIFLHKR